MYARRHNARCHVPCATSTPPSLCLFCASSPVVKALLAHMRQDVVSRIHTGIYDTYNGQGEYEPPIEQSALTSVRQRRQRHAAFVVPGQLSLGARRDGCRPGGATRYMCTDFSNAAYTLSVMAACL